MRRPPALLAVTCLVLGIHAGPGVARGAGSPEAAVQELVERIGAGGFDDLSGVVCPESESNVRAEFDPSASDPAIGDIEVVAIVDPTITLLSEDEGTAIVNLAATLQVTFDEEQLREFVRAQLEAGGEEVTDEAVETMMSALAVSDVPVDEDLTVIERGGEWLICDPGGGFTEAGMCGVVTPDEIAALSPVPIQSNVGSGEYCQWIGATDTDYFSVDVGLIRDASLDDYRSEDPNERELTVGDQPALASFGQLLVEVEGGVLSIVPSLADAPSARDVDPIVFATSVAELFVPRLGQLSTPGDEGEGGAAGGGGGLLADCDIIALEDLAAIGPLTYDTVTGSDGSCVFAAGDPEAGGPYLSIGIDPTTSLADVRELFGAGRDLEVAGRAAYGALDTLWVQLDDATLSVGPVFAGSAAAEGLDPYDYAADVAEHVIAVLEQDG